MLLVMKPCSRHKTFHPVRSLQAFAVLSQVYGMLTLGPESRQYTCSENHAPRGSIVFPFQWLNPSCSASPNAEYA